MKVLITAGPTYEPIDPVRFIGNRSTGKMGFAIAEAFAAKNIDVLFITGPVQRCRRCARNQYARLFVGVSGSRRNGSGRP